jgi:hypothetical protein
MGFKGVGCLHLAPVVTTVMNLRILYKGRIIFPALGDSKFLQKENSPRRAANLQTLCSAFRGASSSSRKYRNATDCAGQRSHPVDRMRDLVKGT